MNDFAKVPELKVGTLYDAKYLLEMVSDGNPVNFAEVRESFYPRIQVASMEDVLSISKACNWFFTDPQGQLSLTKTGREIQETTSSEYQRHLRTQIKSYVETFQPPWAMLLSLGRTCVEAKGAIPADALQCLDEAGFLETSIEGLKEWDELAALAHGRESSRNDEIGLKGEILTKLYEEKRTGAEPRWIARETDSAGFDFVSQINEADMTRLPIEVKASERELNNAYIHISRNEWDVSQSAQNYVFHLWLLGEPLRLFVVHPAGLKSHSPDDQGEGCWESVKIPYVSIIQKGEPEVKEINPIGLTLENAEAFT
jgi:hypothetical protein